MKRLQVKRLMALTGLVLAGLASTAATASGGHTVFEFTPTPDNLASVQRGARDFMNYCSGCHGLKYLRYNRLSSDLGIPEELVEENLMFTTEKFQDHILSAMPDQGEQWFGRKPPDLSLVARLRGPAWVYSFLNSFYADPSRAATGADNLQLPGASMPHILWEQQGWQTLAETEGEHDGHGESSHGGGSPFDLEVPGRLSPEAYQEMTADITNFLVYAAEPGRAKRISLGIKVMFYMMLLIALSYLLKREFWRDVH